MNWYQAQSYCSSLYKGSHLIEVKDAILDYDLAGKTKDNKLYWLGGTDMARVSNDLISYCPALYVC